jgi:hypothetical protein
MTIPKTSRQVNNKEKTLEIEETPLEIEVKLATEEEFKYEEYTTSKVFQHREVIQRLSVACLTTLLQSM